MYNDKAGWGIFFVFGVIFGAFMALMFGTDEDGETKENVRKGVQTTKEGMKEFKKEHIDPVVEVFEEKTREAKVKFDEAMIELNEQLIAMKDSLKNIDRDKYRKIVDEVIADLKKSGNYTARQLSRLQNYFMSDYEQITADVQKAPRK